MIDVAGLVPDAHKGRGLGFQFLDDLSGADALIQVIDASGKTDLEGRASESSDPAEEISFLERELLYWIFSIIERNWKKVRTRDISVLSGMLTGMKIPAHKVEDAARRLSLETKRIDWSEEEKLAFAGEILKCKPILIAANKCDVHCEAEALQKQFPERRIIRCSALYELALKKADAAGAISYPPGSSAFEVKNATGKQKEALEGISSYLAAEGGTGVQQALEELVFNMMSQIVAFPVEDESKWSDSRGNILPNSFLLSRGSTPLDLAAKVHTSLAGGFISALDARKRVRLGREYQLKDCDIIKILSK
jgi:ribosome-binding ATPase YchF (GTP1/OBG family)